MKIEPQHLDIVEGGKAILFCEVHSTEPYWVHWARPHGRLLPSLAIVRKTNFGSELVIDSTCQSDGGWYECHLSNFETHVMDSALINIHGKIGSNISTCTCCSFSIRLLELH